MVRLVFMEPVKRDYRIRYEQDEHYREAKRLRRKNNREREGVWRNNWRRRNMEKVRAQKAVSKALTSGVLIRPDRCEGCGVECKPDAHHENYEKRLEVKWLCKRCHAQADCELRMRVEGRA